MDLRIDISADGLLDISSEAGFVPRDIEFHPDLKHISQSNKLPCRAPGVSKELPRVDTPG